MQGKNVIRAIKWSPPRGLFNQYQKNTVSKTTSLQSTFSTLTHATAVDYHTHVIFKWCVCFFRLFTNRLMAT